MTPQHPSFFIFGPERSGTTLLAFLLSGQPSTFVLNDSFVFDQFVEWALLGNKPRLSKQEKLARLTSSLLPNVRIRSIQDLRYWRRPYYTARTRYASRFSADNILSPADIRGYTQTLRTRYLASLADERTSFLNDYVRGLPQPEEPLSLRDTVSSTINSLSSLFTDVTGMSVGEKTPIHTPYSDWIMDIFPHAKVLLMVRDPVANVASIVKRYGDYRKSVGAYRIYAETMLSLAENPRVKTIRHEDLISSTRNTVEDVLRFLDPELAFDPACPVNSYTKSEYTGKTVDATRAGPTPNTLTQSQEREIRARFSDIQSRFY